MANNSTVFVGIIHWCKDAVGDAAQDLVWYKEMGDKIAVNMATLQCGVGRVKVDDRYGIVDLSFGCARTLFTPPDAGEEDPWD